MYYTYQIHYKFRGQDRRADVHQYSSHRFVYLREDDLMKEIGGQIYFTNEGEAVYKRPKPLADLQDLFKALSRQFQPIKQE
jgi:hypothetical protein